MLRYLRIRNLAIIESVSVEFEPGLNVLTGETGAGKSILVEAVSLLLGGRASSDLVRTGEDLAEVEALFDHDGREVVVRRELTTQGRSRAFVDGALATAGALRELSERLIELHGQHEHQVLADPASHLDLLDEYGGLGAARDQAASRFAAVEALRRERDRLRVDERQMLARIDLLTFQRDEIARANPQPGEDDQLAATRQVLANAERLRALAADAYAALYEADHAALASLTAVWRRVGELASLDSRFGPYLDAKDAIKSQLEDLADVLRGYGEDIDTAPGRLQEIEDRLAVLERLKKKYGPTLEDVRAHGEAAARELDQLASGEARAAEIDSELATAGAAYLACARALSSARRSSARELSRALVSRLADLAMTDARFEVRFNDAEPPEAAWSAAGLDAAEFLVSFNPGEDVRPLARIASGGELSRMMLAIRSVSRPQTDGRTLIFDEVDAGIGGRAADAVGTSLAALGRSTQVLCITHLPQIAACGATHFQVTKSVAAGRTLTSVRRLDQATRQAELARMMAGQAVSKAALASAAELLARRAIDIGAKGESERRKAKGRS